MPGFKPERKSYAMKKQLPLILTQSLILTAHVCGMFSGGRKSKADGDETV